jgi:hypothetical protein
MTERDSGANDGAQTTQSDGENIPPEFRSLFDALTKHLDDKFEKSIPMLIEKAISPLRNDFSSLQSDFSSLKSDLNSLDSKVSSMDRRFDEVQTNASIARREFVAIRDAPYPDVIPEKRGHSYGHRKTKLAVG